MLHHPTVDKLHALRLPGMAAALAEQQSQDGIDRLGFEERLGLLVERESSERDSRQTAARLRRARLKVPDASPEDIDYRTARGLDRALTARLLTGEWLRERQNLILVGPTGLGKSWLGCAFAIQACRQGFSACYLRVPKLNEELAIAHGAMARTTCQDGSRDSRRSCNGAADRFRAARPAGGAR
jgi:DNA replication protein DnaC